MQNTYDNGARRQGSIFAYNNYGELVEVADGTGITTSFLDLLSRITSVNDSHGAVTDYQYGTAGNQADIIYSEAQLSNTITTY